MLLTFTVMSPCYIPVRVNISNQCQELLNELKKTCLNIWDCFKTDRFLDFLQRNEQAVDTSEIQWFNLNHLHSSGNAYIVCTMNITNQHVYQQMTEDAETFTPSNRIYGMIKEARAFI